MMYFQKSIFDDPFLKEASTYSKYFLQVILYNDIE